VAEADAVLVAAALLIFLGVVASKVSSRLGVPAVLLFLIVGMLAGSEGVGGIDFTDHELAQAIGIVALALILFAGGLDTEWSDVRPVLGKGLLLATVGVPITAMVVGTVAAWVLGVSLAVGLLLGSIVSSTDAAAVFSVLRSRNVGLKGRLRPLLELESGSNDPMAVFLTLAFISVITDDGGGVAELVGVFVLQAVVGAVVGFAMAKGAVMAINRARLEYEGLYPVLMIAIVLLAYGGAAVLGGSGFLAVYVTGLMMGNARFLHKKSLMRFADGLAWLMQIAMFLVLGLLVFPSDVASVAGRALVVSLALIFVARPVAVGIVLGLTRLGVRETLLVAWVGLRGAVPIVLATFPLVEGVPEASLIFNVVFFIVLTSVLVQGPTLPLVARWLRVDAPFERQRPFLLDIVESGDGATDLHEVTVAPGSPASGRQIVDLRLPTGTLVVLLSREDEFVVPQGSTVVRAGDNILLVADQDMLPAARALFAGDEGDGT
jgi:cell volume regulation protein A